MTKPLKPQMNTTTTTIIYHICMIEPGVLALRLGPVCKEEDPQ